MTVTNTSVAAGQAVFDNSRPFALIAGPCQMESRDHAMMIAERMKRITEDLGIGFVFKASFDKANRTSLSGRRGIGLSAALPVFEEIARTFGLPVLTDVHTEEQCREAAVICDILQIPAFLCRQTDLLIAAAETGRVVNIKKGQFLAPDDMRYPLEKVRASGNTRVLLTERGTSFGYHNLVVDMRTFPQLRALGVPVIYDVTHSLQLPGAGDGRTAGQAAYIEPIACAGVAAGVDGVFMEVHESPARAKSDAENALRLDLLPALLQRLLRVHAAVHA